MKNEVEDIYNADVEMNNALNELRFFKTMRELLNKLGLGEIDEFDDVLIDIASRAEKRASAGNIASKYLSFSKTDKILNFKSKDLSFTSPDF